MLYFYSVLLWISSACAGKITGKCKKIQHRRLKFTAKHRKNIAQGIGFFLPAHCAVILIVTLFQCIFMRYAVFYTSQVARVQGCAKLSPCITAKGGKFFYHFSVHNIAWNLSTMLGRSVKQFLYNETARLQGHAKE